MKNKLLLTCTIIGLASLLSFSQTTENKKEESKEEKFAFGNISPVILAKDGIEASAITNLTSYWVTSKYGSTILDRYRISRSENYANISYGFSESRRWDLGAQIRYSKILIDENARNSPFNVFSKPDSSSTAYSGISTLGIRLRLSPFINIPELTFQASINFPMAREQETRSFLGADRVQTDLVSTYYKAITDDIYIYLQGRYILQIANSENSKSSHFPGISTYLVKSLFDQRLFLFPGLTYLGSFQQNYKGGRLTNQAQFLMAGIGLQFQPIEKVSIFLNGQKPLYHKSSASFYSDLVRNSYSDWSLGLRILM